MEIMSLNALLRDKQHVVPPRSELVPGNWYLAAGTWKLIGQELRERRELVHLVRDGAQDHQQRQRQQHAPETP